MTVSIRLYKAVRLGIFAVIICLAVSLPTGRTAADQPKLNAPGGAEIDFARDVTKCFGMDLKPVQAYWKNYRIEAAYLEYNRTAGTVKAQGKVRMIQNSPFSRIITCDELFFELQRDYLNAGKEVKVIYDENTTLVGDSLEWDRLNDEVKVTGAPQINYKDWQITGEQIEGQVNKGIFIFFGPVKGVGNDGSFRAGQIVFDCTQDKIFLKNNPVVVQGKNQFTAPEIIYDLKTRKAYTKSDGSII